MPDNGAMPGNGRYILWVVAGLAFAVFVLVSVAAPWFWLASSALALIAVRLIHRAAPRLGVAVAIVVVLAVFLSVAAPAAVTIVESVRV